MIEDQFIIKFRLDLSNSNKNLKPKQVFILFDILELRFQFNDESANFHWFQCNC